MTKMDKVEKNSSVPNPELLVVPDRLVKPHRLIRKTQIELKARTYLDKGLIPVRNTSCPHIHVSPKLLSRALRVMDTLFKYFEELGGKVEVDEEYGRYSTYVYCSDEQVQISMIEGTKMQKREGERLYGDRCEFVPTGKLIFRIDNIYGSGLRAKWSDGSRGFIEDQMVSVVDGIFKAAEAVKKQRLEREKWHRELEEKQEQKRREAEKVLLDNQAIERLEKAASDWEMSQRIRRFLEVLEQHVELNEEDKASFGEWCNWAREHADRIDPLLNFTITRAIG